MLRLHPDLPLVHRPAVNEELGATAVMGSQLAATRPDATLLSGAMSAGRMMPESRMNSSPWLSVTHFSPRMTRLPLASYW